ncbi:hypothetical protein BC835DRAFT_1329496 [Cytidiella melzeri]|nr:hypothetical protein BC835DRAFT_1329496 [Cytidiella melzeri]
MTDHYTLAHFFLSQMYAKSHELGYDPTMKPAADKRPRYRNQWDITVHYVEEGSAGDDGTEVKTGTATFRTIQVLSNVGAETIRSRGTRVWQARQIINGKEQPETVVIKDYWVDSDRMREATIWRNMLQDAPSDELREPLKRHLLTPLYSGDVVIGGQIDNTLSLLRRGTALPKDLEPFATVHLAPLPTSEETVPEEHPLAPQGAGIIPPQAPPPPEMMVFHDKSHHRIVFKETAKTIENLNTVGTTLQAAGQTLGALSLIHACGWVHRDISSGNILIVDGIVKIADLEYAKRMSDSSSNSSRSGTATFMSIEADYHAHKFRLKEGRKPVPTQGLFSSKYGQRFRPIGGKRGSQTRPSKAQGNASPQIATPVPPPFRYNPLHDVESVWWLLVYLTLYRIAEVADDTNVRRQAQRQLYSHMLGSREVRRGAFMERDTFSANKGCLHDRLQPIADMLEEASNNTCGTLLPS